MGAKKISEIVHEISKVSFNSLINAFSKASNADKACKKLKESKFGESQLPCFQSDWHFLIYRWTPADLDFLKNVFTEGNVTCLYNSFLHIFLKQLGFAEMFFFRCRIWFSLKFVRLPSVLTQHLDRTKFIRSRSPESPEFQRLGFLLGFGLLFRNEVSFRGGYIDIRYNDLNDMIIYLIYPYGLYIYIFFFLNMQL